MIFLRTKKEIIIIAKNLNISGEDESFYRFGCNYLFGMKRRGVTDKAEFFNMLRFGEEKPWTVRQFFGVSGKHSDEAIKRWCSLMIRQSSTSFSTLDIDDLRQLFGYCAYEAKIRNNANKPDKSKGYNNSYTAGRRNN